MAKYKPVVSAEDLKQLVGKHGGEIIQINRNENSLFKTLVTILANGNSLKPAEQKAKGIIDTLQDFYSMSCLAHHDTTNPAYWPEVKKLPVRLKDAVCGVLKPYAVKNPNHRDLLPLYSSNEHSNFFTMPFLKETKKQRIERKKDEMYWSKVRFKSSIN